MRRSIRNGAQGSGRGSADWPDVHVVVKGWSEAMALLREVVDEASDAVGVRVGFFTQLESRRENWALGMLRGAHVPEGAGEVVWKTFAGTA